MYAHVLFRGLSIECSGQPKGDTTSRSLHLVHIIGLNAKGILWRAFHFKIIFNAKQIYKDQEYFFKKMLYVLSTFQEICIYLLSIYSKLYILNTTFYFQCKNENAKKRLINN